MANPQKGRPTSYESIKQPFDSSPSKDCGVSWETVILPTPSFLHREQQQQQTENKVPMASQMGSKIDPGGRPYDLALSKRTRKPLKLEETLSSDISVTGCAQNQGSEAFLDQEKGIAGEELAGDRQSLKQLINSEENPLLELGEERRRRSSLGHHLTVTEEVAQLHQVVRVRAKQRQGGGAEGMRLKGMVSRCAKVLSQLVKGHPPAAGGSKKQLILRLTN